jgi:hypothetical protein
VTELVDLSVRVVELEQSLPEGTTARQFLQMVMRGELEPTPRQMTAAKVLIEYQEAKLTAVAMGHFDKTDFASMLERAIERSKAPYVPRPALLPAPIEHSRDEVRGPFVRRRKNLR